MERICKHCGKTFDTSGKPSSFMASHSRWCKSNPKRKEYVDKLKNARAAKTEEGRKLAAKKVQKHHQAGTYDAAKKHQRENPPFKGKKHTKATKEKLRQAALASDHRRLKKGVVVYKGVTLDSSWELSLAQRLDELKVRWERPAPLKWKDAKGYTRNYFPDFYLPDYDLYLDPKNPYAFRVQKKKVDIISEIYPNVIWIRSLEECQQYTPR